MALSTQNPVGTIPRPPRKEKQDICYWDTATASWEPRRVEFNILLSSNMPPPPETLVDHQSSLFDHQPPRSRGFKAREEEPLANHPSSLFVQ